MPEGGAPVPRARFRPCHLPVPAAWRPAVAKVLIPREAIERRVRALARDIERDYRGVPLVVVALLNGTLFFVADLLRRMTLPLQLDSMGFSSYRQRKRPGRFFFTKDLRLDLRDREVLLVDDILDTGNTLARALARIRRLHPRRVRTCVLLEKDVARPVALTPDYVGFRIPDVFVVGYGLDYAEDYRHLPFVGVLRPSPGVEP